MSATSVSQRIAKYRLVKALWGVKDERVKKLLVERLSIVMAQLPSAWKKQKPLMGYMPLPPERFLVDIGQRRLRPNDPGATFRLAYAIYEATKPELAKPGFAMRFKKVWETLQRKQRAITDSTDLVDLMTTIAQHEGKKLPRKQYTSLLQRLASKASEDAVIGHPEFQTALVAKGEEMKGLAADSKRLDRLHLASLDPQPQIFTKIRTAGSSGPTEARYLYVDIWVVYPAKSVSKQVLYVTGIKAQIKLWMVETLVPHTDIKGRWRIGQLLNDELRGPRGAWRVHEVRIPRERIIDDPRMRMVISMGSQDLTEEQLALLKKNGINHKHILHDIPYGDFYDWAHAGLKAANITVTP